jgi:hypothetical protein
MSASVGKNQVGWKIERILGRYRDQSKRLEESAAAVGAGVASVQLIDVKLLFG